MFEYYATVLRVVDGDTIDLDIDLGFSIHFKERVRLLGINTPETYGVKKDSEEYAAGMLAKNRLEELCPLGSIVRVETKKDKKGKYGRILGTVYCDAESRSVNDVLLAEGLAEVY